MPRPAESVLPLETSSAPSPALISSDDVTRRFPSDTAYRRLHWICMAVIAAIVIGSLVAPYVPGAPRLFGIRLIAAIMLPFNALWWSIADRRFARYVCSARRSRLIRSLVLIFSLAMNAPIIEMLLFAHPPLFQMTPTWYAAAVTLWQLGLVVCMPIIAALRLIGLGLWWIFSRSVLQSADAEPEPFDPSRRAVLKTAFATAPVTLLAGLTVVSRAQESRLFVRRHDLPAPWLPGRLRGLTITHITDLHVGRLFRPRMLPGLIDKVNALGSDIVMVTGDIVDNSNLLLPDALNALGRITHRHGMFLCLGNHDQIDSREDFIRAVRERQFKLLINQRRAVEIGGERITIAGLDFANSDEPGGRRRMGNIANIGETLDGYQQRTEGPVIALAHHPHTWDVLARAGVPLTLSGHTHGGQIMLTPPDERPDIGIGRILFRYTRGFYRDGTSTLFVNSGVGNWFPLRIHAPAEIVQIRLI